MNTPKLTSEEAMNLLKNVPEEWQAFWCNHGTVLRNLADLSAALADMSAEEFAHHVNGEKNDFATWTEDVLGDATLANKLRLLSSAEASQRMVARRIEELTLAITPASEAAPTTETTPAPAAEATTETATAEAAPTKPASSSVEKKTVKAKKAAAKAPKAAKKAVSPAPKVAAAKKQSVWSKLLKR